MRSWAIGRTSWKGFTLLRKETFRMSQFDKKPNLYSLLQLKPGAKQKDIKYNYYKLIRQYHPDLSTDPVAHAKLLNEAYAILSDEKMRERYDREHGFDNFDPTKNPQKKQKPEDYSKTDQMDKKYNEAKKGFSSVLGDKAERMQTKMLAIFAVAITIATATLIFGEGQTRSRKSQAGIFSQGFSKENFERSFQTKIRGEGSSQ